MSRKSIAFELLANVLLVLLPALAWGDSKSPKPPPTEFETLISRIRAAAEGDQWRTAEWKDAAIEAALKKALGSVKATTGKDISLPVEFKVVKTQPARGGGIEGGVLHVAQENVDATFVNRSIILADGSVRIGFASDCIVVARGVVEIAHANKCLVIAGHHVNISHDGNGGFAPAPGGGRQAPGGSVVISGGSIEVSHAHGTICSAPRHVDIGHATQVDFVASPNRENSHQRDCNFFDKADAPLAIPSPEPLPAAVFTVKQVVAPDDHARQLITVERNGIEYVLRPGNKVMDEKGEPIAGWSMWKVGFITENLVLFTDGQRDISVRVP